MKQLRIRCYQVEVEVRELIKTETYKGTYFDTIQSQYKLKRHSFLFYTKYKRSSRYWKSILDDELADKGIFNPTSIRAYWKATFYERNEDVKKLFTTEIKEKES